MQKVKALFVGFVVAAICFLLTSSAMATINDVTIDGSDAIFLAGRTDVTVPPASAPWTTGTHLIRHLGPTPEEIQETLPPFSVLLLEKLYELQIPQSVVSVFLTVLVHLFLVQAVVELLAATSLRWMASAAIEVRKGH